jgi:predicted transcriptional regulator
MATTIHVPETLLKKIDRRAKALGKSRNRFIVEALAEKVGTATEWPADFLRELTRPVSRGVERAADEMLREIQSHRRSRRKPPNL